MIAMFEFSLEAFFKRNFDDMQLGPDRRFLFAGFVLLDHSFSPHFGGRFTAYRINCRGTFQHRLPFLCILTVYYNCSEHMNSLTYKVHNIGVVRCQYKKYQDRSGHRDTRQTILNCLHYLLMNREGTENSLFRYLLRFSTARAMAGCLPSLHSYAPGEICFSVQLQTKPVVQSNVNNRIRCAPGRQQGREMKCEIR